MGYAVATRREGAGDRPRLRASSSRRPISAAPCRRCASRGAWCAHRLTNLTEHDHVLLHELQGRRRRRLHGAAHAASAATGRCPSSPSPPTAASGFSDEDIADLTRLVDMMGAVTEMHIERSVAETVANTYLGPDVGQRVLNGADPPRRGRGDPRRAVVLRPARLHRHERAPAGGRGAGAAEQLPAARGRRAGVQRRRDPEIHRRRRDGLFPGRGCAVPADGDGPGARRGAPADRRHRGGQRGARHGRPRSAALRHRPACRRR